MKRTRITDTLTFLEPDSYAGFRSCAGLLVEGPPRLLIDANMGSADTRPLLRAAPPDAAVISHYHIDHSVWGADVLELTDAPVFLPESEKELLSDVAGFAARTAGPYGNPEGWAGFVTERCGFRPFSTVHGYDGAAAFTGGRLSMQVVPTPGHSPGHASFFFPEDRVLFTGDMGIDRFGPWYGWRDCSLPDMITSLRRLKGLHARVLLTSHGGMATERIDALWDRAEEVVFEREAVIRDALEAGRTRAQIVADGIFFPEKNGVPEPMRGFLFMWDCYMFDHHAALLESGGLAAALR